jgi:acetyl/propionyl-CoA carboxylase alpha subunit
VEWVWDGKDGIYFLEVNARLQVEHPVTEMVWNIDLVEMQLRVARGEAIEGLETNSVGHAIEVRVCAEDPMRDFMPSGGKIHRLQLPKQARVDFGFREKNNVPSQFDSMLGKIIVHGKDRNEALSKMREALKELVLFGPATNRTYLIQLLNDERVISGKIYTTLLSKIAARFNEVEAIRLIRKLKQPIVTSEDDLDFYSPWGQIQRTSEDLHFEDFEEKRFYHTHFADWNSARPRKASLSGASDETASHDNAIRSPMPAKVVRVLVNAGDAVKKGDLLLVVEAMKMEHQMKATHPAIIKSVTASVGERVGQDQILLEFVSENSKIKVS